MNDYDNHVTLLLLRAASHIYAKPSVSNVGRPLLTMSGEMTFYFEEVLSDEEAEQPTRSVSSPPQARRTFPLPWC